MNTVSTSPKPERKERFEARITRAQKALISQAAELEGSSVSDFVIKSASEAARRVVQDQHVIRLSSEEQATVVKALLAPPEPTPRLREAVKRYRKIMGR